MSALRSNGVFCLKTYTANTYSPQPCPFLFRLMSALRSNGVFCLKTYTANTYWRLRFFIVVQWVAFSTSTSVLKAVDARQVPKADDPERREFFKKYTKNLDDLVNKDSFLMDFNKLYQKTACAMAFDSSQVRPLMIRGDRWRVQTSALCGASSSCFDSSQVFGCVQPDAMKAHERKQRESTADGDESTRTATSLSDTVRHSPPSAPGAAGLRAAA